MLKRVSILVGKTLLVLLILAAAALPAVFLNTLYGYLTVLLVLFAMLLSGLALLWQRGRVEVVFEGAGAECLRGETVQAQLEIRNAALWACPRATAELVISDLFGGVDTAMPISFCLPAHSSAPFSFALDMPHVGIYEVKLTALKLSGSFGLLQLRVPTEGAFSVCVKPRLKELEPLEENQEYMTESVQNTRRTVPGGSDYVGVREYALGDPIKQIHWKLSAHSRGYLTKLSETGRQANFAVLLDLAVPKAKAERCMELNDSLIEIACSAVQQVIRSYPDCMLLYCERGGDIRRRAMQRGEPDGELLRELHPVAPEPPPSFPDACAILNAESRMQGRSTHLIVCTARLTTELVQQLLEVQRQKCSPALYYILPAQLTRREREQCMVPLHQLEDAGVPCIVFETDPPCERRS